MRMIADDPRLTRGALCGCGRQTAWRAAFTPLLVIICLFMGSQTGNSKWEIEVSLGMKYRKSEGGVDMEGIGHART
jgi:hypothetical protein